MKQAVLAVMVAGALATTGPFAVDSTAAARPSPRLQAGAPGGEVDLGSVRIGRRVLADGRPLADGTYQLRLTAQEARPDAAGADAALERWVEFIEAGVVKGREVVSIVPADEIRDVAKANPPAPGTSRVEVLKGDEYLRIWVNRGGVHYLIHLPVTPPSGRTARGAGGCRA